jgi:hypothetical protein
MPLITHSRLSLLALGILTLVGCSSTVSRTSSTTPQPAEMNVTATPSPNPIDPNSIPTDTKITLSRTICYGTCPAYKLEIFANGRVVFHGQAHVRKTGTVTWQISQDRIKQLVSEFHNINYFSLADDYSLSSRKNCPNFGTDAPSVTTSLTLNGQTKTVGHSHGCQGLEILSQLVSFEDRIDELADSKRHIG